MLFPLCTQADELRALAGLARDAAEILFEMAALQDESEAAQDMLEKSQQLEVRFSAWAAKPTLARWAILAAFSMMHG